MLVISQKIPVLGKIGNLVPFWANIVQFDISGSTWRIYLKLRSIIWSNKRSKVICLKFPKNYLLGSNGQFGLISGVNYAICYLKNRPKHFFFLCSKISIIRGQIWHVYCFPKDLSFGANGQFRPILWLSYAIDISGSAWRFFLKKRNIIWYYKKTKMMCLKFPEKSTSWGQMYDSGPFFVYVISKTALRTFFKLCSKARFLKRTKMACLLFLRKSLCWSKLSHWSKLCNLISQDFLETLQPNLA